MSPLCRNLRHVVTYSGGGAVIESEKERKRSIRVIRTDDNRRSSDLIFLKQLNDLDARKRYHRHEADDDEKAGHWFAAAFHLRPLIALAEPDADKLTARLKVCEDKLKQP